MRIRIPEGATVEYYTVRGPHPPGGRARIDSGDLTPVADPAALAKLTRECSALRLRLATAERLERRKSTAAPTPAPTPGSTPATSARTPPSATLDIALESAYVRRNAVRNQVQAEMSRLAERYRVLEQTLYQMQETLRTKDKEIEGLRRERDRLLAEREAAERERTRSPASSVRSDGSATVYYARSDRYSYQTRSTVTARAPRSVAQVVRVEEPQPVRPGSRMTLEMERAARAKSMDVFLTKTDNWSGAQVIQAVEDLNAEISQFAAAATESCSFAKRARMRQPAADAAALAKLQESTPWLGAPLIRILASRDHTQDPIMVQLALQTSIATCCARSLSLFCVGFPSKLDALLSRVLSHLQSSEPQATSARWRALSHRAIRMLYPGLEEYAVNELVTTMLRWATSIFTVSGSEGTAATTPSPALHGLSSQLRRIAEAAYKLARITREEILSTTFELVFIESGDSFDDARMTNKMRDYGEEMVEHPPRRPPGANGQPPRRESGKVLCTTELGLRCVTRKDTKGTATEELPASELFDSRTLLLPKVVLDTAMDVIDRG